MTYNIWNIQAISGQYQGPPAIQLQPDVTQEQFIDTLSGFFAQSAATPPPAPAQASLHSFVFPRMREVQHVDLNDLSSKKKVHKYIA